MPPIGRARCRCTEVPVEMGVADFPERRRITRLVARVVEMQGSAFVIPQLQLAFSHIIVYHADVAGLLEQGREPRAAGGIVAFLILPDRLMQSARKAVGTMVCTRPRSRSSM